MKRLVYGALCASIGMMSRIEAMDFSGSYKIVRASTISRVLLSDLKRVMELPATQHSFKVCAERYCAAPDARAILQSTIISPLPVEQQKEVRETTEALVNACTCCMQHFYTDYGKTWTINVNEIHDGSYEVNFPMIGSLVHGKPFHIAGEMIRNYPTVFIAHIKRLEPRKPRRCLNR